MFSYLTFINNFDFIDKGLPDASILGVLWSVAIEEQFYLVWPVILYLLPIKKYWIAFTTIITASIIYRYFNQSYLHHEFHTLSCIGDMAIGAFGAWLVLENARFKKNITQLNVSFIILLYFVFILIFLFRDEYYHASIAVFERSFIAIVILLIILEQNFSKNSFFKMSSFKKISKLGSISYGLYCLHFIGILVAINIFDILSINQNIWQVLFLETIVALSITIFISKLSFRYFEKPFLKYKNKFSYIKK